VRVDLSAAALVGCGRAEGRCTTAERVRVRPMVDMRWVMLGTSAVGSRRWLASAAAVCWCRAARAVCRRGVWGLAAGARWCGVKLVVGLG
jgi:hypothetical protein